MVTTKGSHLQKFARSEPKGGSKGPGIFGRMAVQAESKSTQSPTYPILLPHLDQGSCQSNIVTRSPHDVTRRLDQLIEEIREKWHKPVMDQGSDQCGDVLLVAHGHILRAFAMRWAGYALREGPTFLLEAGGVGTLR
jgi:broad specificity phosphatase PhoE